MGQQYLIDSNAVIDYLSGKLPETGMTFMDQVINDIPIISIITKIEILSYNTTTEAYLLLAGFVDDSVQYGLTDDIIDETIKIRKEFKLKTPDAIIAATAIKNEYTLISRNEKDFKLIAGLEIINPHHI